MSPSDTGGECINIKTVEDAKALCEAVNHLSDVKGENTPNDQFIQDAIDRDEMLSSGVSPNGNGFVEAADDCKYVLQECVEEWERIMTNARKPKSVSVDTLSHLENVRRTVKYLDITIHRLVDCLHHLDTNLTYLEKEINGN